MVESSFDNSTKRLSICLQTKWLCGFESYYSLRNFRNRACFEQVVPLYSGSYSV